MIEHLKEKMRKINWKSVEEPYSSDDSQIEYNGNKINKFEDILDSMDFSFKGIIYCCIMVNYSPLQSNFLLLTFVIFFRLWQ